MMLDAVAWMDFLSPPQREMMEATAPFIAYGGARGGGKSWALRKKAVLLCVRYPGIKVLVIRRTYPELRENHILPMTSDLLGMADYRETDKSIVFPNGSRIRFGYCETEADVLQYQGQEYDIVMIDEATQLTEFQYQTLTACIRGVNDFPKRMYLTCNPGGVGHSWVKRLFIDRQYRDGENPENYVFIQARVYDNKPLLDSQPSYVKTLQALPDDLREAWLNGSWDVFAGQYFKEWDRSVHVIEPFEIPDWWNHYFVMDYGLDMLAGYWIAVDDTGKAYVYREIYESNLIISAAAEKILSYMTGKERSLIRAWYAPQDLWNRRQDTGKSVADIFSEYGIFLVQAKNDRVQGWLEVKEWLRVKDGESDIKFFRTCPNVIRCFPLVQYDKRNVNDISNEPHELTHSLDAIRYFISGRPMPAVKPKEDEEETTEKQISDFLSYGRN